MPSIRESENVTVELEALANPHVLKWCLEFMYRSWPIFRRVRLAAKSAYELRLFRSSVRTYQRGSHWTDFREI
jgi:hypothetical protein